MAKSKAVVIIVAACAGFGVLVIASCAGLVYMGFKSTEATVSPRIETIFSAMEKGTFAETYETETTQEFRNAVTKEQYEDLGKAIYSRLGALKTKTLQGFNMRQSSAESHIGVTYEATFEKGNGTIKARMEKQGDEWKFVRLHVDSLDIQREIGMVRCAYCDKPHAVSARLCPSCGEEVASDRDPDESF